MKEKLHNIEFIRSLAAIGIICFHYACTTIGEYKFMLAFANGSWGDIFVIIFFALSGGLLYLNDKEISSPKEFYYKRFKAIFPSFYIAWLIFFLENVIKTKTFFYNSSASPFSLILTVGGVDGYFNYVAPNYYILGEWFLGAIIILYVIYPLLLKGMTQKFFLTTIIILSTFLSINFYNVFLINPFRNVFTCIFPFYLGMILFKYKNLLDNIIIFLISMIAVIIMSLWTVPLKYGIIIEEIYGIALFIVLYNLGKIVVKFKLFERIFDFIGGISFQIFLLQHIIIARILRFCNSIDLIDYWKMLCLTILITIASAYVLKRISNFLIHTRGYLKFESYILKK